MDLVAKNKETEISKVLLYTYSAFVPLLEDRRAEIEKIEKKTFQYGERFRHQLDVYYPQQAAVTCNGKTPVLFFIYGGGYNTGSRILPEPYSMGYRALGSFFAQRGFLTIIPDYRLVPEVRFPAASEDVRDAVVWVSQNTQAISSSAIPEPDVDNMFIMGHSAGSVHTKVMMFHPDLRTTVPSLKGLILSAGAWTFTPPDVVVDAEGPVTFYFGSPEKKKEREPKGLFEKLSDEEVNNLPEILMVQAEREPEWLKASGQVMVKDLERRLGKPVTQVIGQGHNHVSPNWALCSGEGEEWGEEITEWVKARIA